MCIQLKKSFLAEEGITTNYDGIHLKNCDQEKVKNFQKVEFRWKNVIFAQNL